MDLFQQIKSIKKLNPSSKNKSKEKSRKFNIKIRSQSNNSKSTKPYKLKSSKLNGVTTSMKHKVKRRKKCIKRLTLETGRFMKNKAKWLKLQEDDTLFLLQKNLSNFKKKRKSLSIKVNTVKPYL